MKQAGQKSRQQAEQIAQRIAVNISANIPNRSTKLAGVGLQVGDFLLERQHGFRLLDRVAVLEIVDSLAKRRGVRFELAGIRLQIGDLRPSFP